MKKGSFFLPRVMWAKTIGALIVLRVNVFRAKVLGFGGWERQHQNEKTCLVVYGVHRQNHPNCGPGFLV